jgi:predicted glycosyltransferase
VFPISRYFRALDFAVAAAGYNSFHELVGFGVPTAFVPNPSMPLDDQPARARWAAAPAPRCASRRDGGRRRTRP